MAASASQPKIAGSVAPSLMSIHGPRSTDAIKGKEGKEERKGRKSNSQPVKGGISNAQPGKGTFWHYRHKKKTFFYEDIRKRQDRMFHLDVGTECDTYYRGQSVQYKLKRAEVYYHVVDIDHYEYHKIVFESYLNMVLQSLVFRVVILALVLLSSILTGVSTDTKVQEEHSEIFKVVDQVILSVFVFEIMLKWMYDFRLFWTGFWNYMDFIVVALIILTSVIPISAVGGGATLNVIRVVRAFRSLKSLSSLSSLTIVYHTVIKSGIDLLNILLVLIVFMMVLSIMGVILFDLKELNEEDNPKFLNALDAWFVLFICLTQDGWASTLGYYRDVGKEYFPLVSAYLILAVAVGAFVFANLIVAVIVANLELSVKELQEERMLYDDPLDTKEGFVIDELNIIPTYDLLAKRPHALLCQRPMKIPNLKHISLRRLQTYTNLIVALEQNMLESEIIHLDYQKIMAVILSIILQLDVYSEPTTEKEKEEGNEVLQGLRRLSVYPNETPKDALDRMEQAAFITKLKHHQQAQNVNPSKVRM